MHESRTPAWAAGYLPAAICTTTPLVKAPAVIVSHMPILLQHRVLECPSCFVDGAQRCTGRLMAAANSTMQHRTAIEIASRGYKEQQPALAHPFTPPEACLVFQQASTHTDT
jgi:hypothetical protein